MANYDSVLERTAVVIVVDDSKLQSELKKATDQVKRAAKDQADAQKPVAKGAADSQKGFAELRAEIARLREQTIRIKRDADAYLDTQKRQATAARADAAAQKELDARIKELGLQVRNTRSAFINGRIASDQFTRSSEGLKTEINELLNSTTLTTAQQLKLNIASATAERGLSSVRGEASRLGLAWNVQIGLANQFQQQLRGLGPIGAAAAGGLGLIQNGFAGLQRPIDLSGISLNKFLASAVRAPQVLALATAAATTLAVVGLARLASSAAKVADDIDKASQSAGLSAEAFQEITFALSQNGVSLEQARQGLNDFNARLGQAAQGSTGVAKAYDQLGVSIRDASGEVRDSDAVFTDLIGALSGVESAALQAAIGGQVFGEEFSRRIIPALRGGAEGFADLRAQARELGLVISGDAIISLVKFKDEVAVLQRQFATARVEIAAAFLPILRDVLMPLIQNTVVPWIQTAADRVSTFATRFTEAGTAGDTFRAQLVDLITPLLRIADVLTGVGLGFVAFANFVGGATAAAGAAIGTLSVQLEDWLGKLKDLAPALANLSSPATAIRGIIQLGQLPDATFANPFSGAAIGESAGAASAPFFERGNNAALAAGEAFGRAFVTGYDGILDGLATSTREALARGASTAFGAGGTDTTPPPATGDGAGVLPDPAAEARLWTGRLLAEVRFGVKNADDAASLILPAFEKVTNAAQDALIGFGFDSQEYNDALAKVDVLASALDALGARAVSVPVPAILGGTVSRDTRINVPEMPDFVAFSLKMSADARRAAADAAFAASAEAMARLAGMNAEVEAQIRTTVGVIAARSLPVTIGRPGGADPSQLVSLPDAIPVDWGANGVLLAKELDLNAAATAALTAALQTAGIITPPGSSAMFPTGLAADLALQRGLAIPAPAGPPMQGGDRFTPPTTPPEIQGFIDAGAKVRLELAQGADATRLAAVETRQQVALAGLDFASNIAAAIRSGSPSGIFGAATGGIGSLISIFNPIAGQIFSTVGGIFAGLLPSGEGQTSADAQRAAGNAARGAPAVELNLQVFQNLAVQSLTGGDRAAVDGLLDRTVERIDSVLVSFAKRLTDVETRTA